MLQKTRRLHWPFPDPAGHEQESKEQQLQRFRVARQAIEDRLQAFIQAESVGPNES